MSPRLRGSGPQSEIVISSRIRLARNLAEFPFISRASQSDRTEIENILRDRILQIQDHDEFPKFDHRVLPPASRRSLGDSARPPTIPGMPGIVGSHENWGKFKCHKWGELLRHSQLDPPPPDCLPHGLEGVAADSR